ncbi:hypothetical protein M427DRAFT_175300 [Gonapodya prolifera JEL478]|uniref:Uncharacterized protein n=1 Tax=Gonapodya prolifera (strain JEL478) TaxID=1344416 RepID=A0A139B1F2_GONPJ|nr:hypothetical protein M427DRAFT_175300 [Gonapodya prolifera JEL478]|eukprot:KXS22565.1 hypothetical protein M427DRAFT_175300 [Gonapodya prolifera JEL478]
MAKKSTKRRHLTGQLDPSEAAVLDLLRKASICGPKVQVPFPAACSDKKRSDLTDEERAISLELYPVITEFVEKSYPAEARFCTLCKRNSHPFKNSCTFE